MPDKNYPPYPSDTGALTIPRQLIRWLDVNPQGGKLERTMSYLTLPSFVASYYDPPIAEWLPVPWTGYSDIVATFNFECPNNFSLKGFTVPENPNYVLCISYRIDGTVVRYKMWDADGSVLNRDIPLYEGQAIRKNFRFEVWNTSQGNAIQATALQFYTSVRGKIDYRFGTDFALQVTDGQNGDLLIWETANLIPQGRTSAIVVNNLNIGDEYLYDIPSGSIVDGVNIYTGSGTFIATADSVIYTPAIGGSSTGCNLENNTQQQRLFVLPLTFPANSVSVTN